MIKFFKPLKLLSLLFFISTSLNAQHQKCIPNHIRKEISKRIEINKSKLIKEGKLNINKNSIVFFNWPLQQATGYNYNSYYNVTNFVDHDNTSGIEDYNCGTRSYDGHDGTDIALWPYDHNMVQNNQVEIIAAQSGTLLLKNDGEFDNQCSWISGAQSNYVIIAHSDGSESWYFHMKNGSVTTKSVGDAISAGEVIGVVASSGVSTGPHLHFEVRDNNNNVIDPYSGSCNSANNTSWWNTQKPYHEPTINHIQTNNIPVSINPCPNLDAINEETNFMAGDQIYFYAFYHDMLSTIAQNYSVYRPDGTVWQNWSNNATNSFYSQYYYFAYFTIPNNAMLGTWTFEVSFNGQTLSTDFSVLSSLPNLYCEDEGQLSLSLNEIKITNVIVGNNGNGSAGATSDLGYYLSTNTTITTGDYLIEDDLLTDIAVGATNTRSQTVTPTNIDNLPPDGTYYVGMLIDHEGVIIESNEDDNNDCFFTNSQVTIGCTDPNAHNYSATANFDNANCETCTDGIQNGDETGVDCGGTLCSSCTTPLPNLYCEDGGQLSLSLNEIKITNVIVGNNGNESAGALSDLGYYLSTNTTISTSDYLIEDDLLTDIAVGATNTRSQTVTPTNIDNLPPDGTYYVGMLIDHEGIIIESNENDNNDCFFTNSQVTIGCTDPNAHNYSTTANFDNANCETCTDGIQNGDETGVDCGGTLCGPCCTTEVCNGIDDDCDGIIDYANCNGWLCSNATELTTSSIVSADGPNGGNGASQSDAVHSDWFYIDIPTDGSVSINSCLFGEDTRLWLWEGTCNNLNLIASSDDICPIQPGGVNFASSLSNIPVLAGNRYYIEWDNKWSSNPFTFEFEYFTCSSIVSNYPFIEEFESGSGFFENGHNTDIDWVSISGPTSSNETGVDQTYSMSNYLYVEASVNGIGYPNKSASLISNCFDLSSLTNPEISFGYNMYGIEMGSLSVSISTDNGYTWSNDLLTISGNQGLGWNKALIDLSSYNNNTIKVRLEAVTGTGFRSDIGIDQFIIREKCISTCNGIYDASVSNYFQPFDNGISDFENMNCDNIDFTLNSGATTSTDTGPTDGYPSSGNYIYLEASGTNSPHKIAIVESPCINISNLNEPALFFSYHMYGAGMGFLGIEISADGGNTWLQLSHRNGDLGNSWYTFFYNLNQFSNTVKIRFTGISGSNYLSDIALDYFWVYETCNDFYNVSGNITNNVNYEAENYISSDAECTGGIINFDAGSYVELISGFEITSGVEFNAYIDGCGNNGNEPFQDSNGETLIMSKVITNSTNE